MSTRVALAAILVGGCWSTPSGSTPTATAIAPPPVDPSKLPRTCSEAAIGLERATKDLHDPDQDVLHPIRTQCTSLGWKPAAIACFSAMAAGELARCTHELDDTQRDAMFGVLAGSDRASVAIALVKLANLQVAGIGECERFIATVERVLACDAMPLPTRASLGAETADMWSLPVDHLPASARQRMAAVCQQSLDALTGEAARLGCL